MAGTPSSWSKILQGIMKSASERQRLAVALGVTTMTLSRWASGESRPQKSHLIHLLQVVHPHQRQDLLDALQESYPDIQSWLIEDNSGQISADFFAQVLHVRTTTAASLLFWRISDMVLKQALVQLDPNHTGMAIKIVQCVKPAPGEKVHSLRERTGKGTHPWTTDLEHEVVFLGLESLSGTCVEKSHGIHNNVLEDRTTHPRVQDTYEASAAAHPIRFEGNIAGCLLASSAQQNYFTKQRIDLLEAFTDLISLAFAREDFYPRDQIDLRPMPHPEEQRPILAHFRERVIAKFQETKNRGEQINNLEIEMQTWKDLEVDLITMQEVASRT